MPKTKPKLNDDPKREFPSKLTRRPIKKDSEHPDEKNNKKEHPDEKNNKKEHPDKIKKPHSKPQMHPELEHEANTCSPAVAQTYWKYLLAIGNYWKFSVYVVLMLACITLYVLSNSSTKDTPKDVLEDLKKQFQNQHILTYKILEKALEKVVGARAMPSAPAIFTVLVNENDINKANEFALQLAKGLAPNNYVLINKLMYGYNDPDELKIKIDEKIKSTAENSSLTVVIVNDLHGIHHKAAMVFHGYCDHAIAPYKRAVFMFIVPHNKTIQKNAKSKDLDDIAESQLKKNIWHAATSDDIDSLITRMTVSVISIQ